MKAISQKTVFRMVTLLAVSVFILANLSAGRLAAFWNLSLDFTGERLYSLSAGTKLAVQSLPGGAAVYVISDEASYPPVLHEILRRYALLSSLISIRYIDPYADPVFLDTYNRKGFTLKETDLLVEGNKGMRHIPAGDMFIYDTEGKARGLRLEEKLTNALAYVNSGRDISASFTVGHGERLFTALEDALSGGGFSVRTLALGSGEIPASDIVVIANPERDFPPDETAVLKSYLAEGGRLMVFMGPAAERLPGLESLLESWGLALLPGMVREPFAHSPGNPASLIPMYGMHEINLDFAERQYYLAMPSVQAIEPAEDTPGVAITRLLLSTRDSSAQKDGEKISGPFALAAVAEKPEENAALMLFGSAGIYEAPLMAAQAFANREYLGRSALWLAGREKGEGFSIPPKDLSAPAINAGLGTLLAVFLVYVILLPLSALLAGIGILLRRRGR